MWQEGNVSHNHFIFSILLFIYDEVGICDYTQPLAWFVVIGVFLTEVSL